MRKAFRILLGLAVVLVIGASAYLWSKTRNTCDDGWLTEFNRSPELRKRFGHITWCLKVEEFTHVPGSTPEGAASRWRFRWGTLSHTGSGRRFDTTAEPPASQLWMDGLWFEKRGDVFVPGPPGPEWP